MSSPSTSVYVSIGAKISAKFKAATAEADKSLKKVRQSVAALQKTTKDVTAYRAQHKEVLGAKKAWGEAEKKARELAKSIQSTHAPTRKQTAELRRAQREASKAKRHWEKHRQELGKTRVQLKEGGVDTRRLGTEMRRLGSSLASVEQREKALARAIGVRDKAMKRAAGARRRYQDVSSRARDARSKFTGALLPVAAGAASLGALVRQSMEFEDVMLGVQKQLNGARDEGGQLTEVYFAMRKSLEDLGDSVPLARNELAELATSAMRGGVGKDIADPAASREAVIDFTREAVKIATAFDGIDPGTIGLKMAQLAKNFKIPTTEIGKLGDAINYLDDNSNATGADIINTTMRLSGLSAQLRMSATDTAGLATTFLSLGESEETAATAAKSLLTHLSVAGTKTSKKFLDAMKALKLDAKQVQIDMARDATGTMLDVLKRIQTLPAEQQTSVVTHIVGLENAAKVAKLAGNVAELEKNIGLANSEAAKGSISREFAIKQQALSGQIQILKNRAQRLAVTLGDALVPALRQGMEAATPILEGFAKWAKENPKLVATIVKITAAVAALRLAMLATNAVGLTGKAGLTGIVAKLAQSSAARTAAKAARVGAGGAARSVAGVAKAGAKGAGAALMQGAGYLGSGALSLGGYAKKAGKGGLAKLPKINLGVKKLTGGLSKALSVAGRFVPFLLGGLKSISAAILATPIGWIAAAIAAAAFVVWRYWKPIKAFFSGFWSGFKSSLSGISSDHLPALARAWDKISPIVEKVWSWVKSVFGQVEMTKEGLHAAGEAGKSFGQSIGASIQWALGIVNSLIQRLESAFAWSKKVFEKASAVAGGVRNTASGAWQSVRSFFGAESQAPAQGRASQVAQRLSSTQSASAGARVQQSQTNNIRLTVNGGDPKQVQKAVQDALANEQKRQRSQTRSGFVEAPAY